MAWWREKYKVYRVVFEEIFGNKEAIQANVIESVQKIDEIDTEKNSLLYGYLDYSERLDGLDNQETFSKVRYLSTRYLEFYEQKKSLLNLLDKYKDNQMIESLIEKNIFIKNFKQNAFTEEMLEQISELIEKLDKKIMFLEEWLTKTPTLFDYQNIRNQSSL